MPYQKPYKNKTTYAKVSFKIKVDSFELKEKYKFLVSIWKSLEPYLNNLF